MELFALDNFESSNKYVNKKAALKINEPQLEMHSS